MYKTKEGKTLKETNMISAARQKQMIDEQGWTISILEPNESAQEAYDRLLKQYPSRIIRIYSETTRIRGYHSLYAMHKLGKAEAKPKKRAKTKRKAKAEPEVLASVTMTVDELFNKDTCDKKIDELLAKTNESTELPPLHVEMVYDRSQKLWRLWKEDADGNMIGDEVYIRTGKKDALEMKRALEAEIEEVL